MTPHRTPFFLPLLYPSLQWRVPNVSNSLYLTFDDGPVEGPTEFVLNTLSEFSIKATFFCIGDNVQRYPHVFRKILDAGHHVGNHTFHHLNGWKASVKNYLHDVSLCENELNKFKDGKVDQQLMPIFRPPYGRVSRKQIRALQHYFNIIMWDVLSVDYNKRLSEEKCLRNTLRATRPGSIIVFHDSYKAEKNLVYVLPRFISQCLELGYTFNPIIL